MKKTLLLLASAALLLVGCAKEQIVEKATGEGTQTVSFTVGVESVATKASADEDGQAANINHWVMQVLDSDNEVYNYQEDNGTVGETTHTFNVPLVKGQTYKVLFWADTKGNYVVTDLRNVARAEAVSLIANRDDLDAFSAVVEDFSTTVATQQNIELKRPFAQINVVFTDLKKLYETMGSDTEYAKFKPENFVAKAKVPTTFNVLTQEAGAPAATALEMGAEKCYNPSGVEGQDNYTTHENKATLYMDYIFTSKSAKDIVDIDFSFVSKGVTIAHNFASVPFQRNYRTNILGELMSAGAQWTVEVKPEWNTPENDWNYVVEGSVAAAIKALKDGKTAIEITAPEDYATPVALPTQADGKDISIKITGVSGKDMSFVLGEGAQGPANLYLTTDAEDLIINLPNSHVEVNGGTYQNVTATTSANTLVVGKDVSIASLTINGGNAEIYGVVNAISKQVSSSVVNFYVGTAAALRGVASSITAAPQNKDFAGKVYITADIDLNNEEWTPIAAFQKPLTIEGNGYTIKNLKVTESTAAYIGFISTACGLTVKNLNFDTVTLSYPSTVGENARGGVIAGQVYGATIENCSVKNVDITACQKVGGLLGYIEGNTNVPHIIKNCSVEKVSIKSNDPAKILQHGVGGFIGHISLSNNPLVSISGCSVKDVTIANFGTEYSMQLVPHVFIGNACNTHTGTEVADITSHSIVLENNTITGTNTELPTCIYSSEYFGWAGNAEERPAWKGGIYIDGQAWAPDYPVKNVTTGKGYITLKDAVDAASAEEEIEILKAGTYTVPTISKNITITGEGDVNENGVVFNCVGSGSIASIPNGATFKNVTMNFGQSNYHGFQHAGHITMEECVLNGLFFSYGDMTFTDCIFNQEAEEYNMWAYGKDITYDGCTFNSKGKFINVYCESNSEAYNIVAKDCIFNTSKANKPALNIKETCGATFLKYNVTITNCSCNDLQKTVDMNSTSSKYVGSPIWQVDDIKAGDAAINVTVDEVKMFPPTSFKVASADALKSAVNMVNSGKEAVEYTIELADGTYEVSDMAIAENVNGKTVIIKAANEGQVTLKMNADTKSKQIFLVDGYSGNYPSYRLVIDGFKFDLTAVTSGTAAPVYAFQAGDGLASTIGYTTKGPNLRYAHHITIQNCELVGAQGKENAMMFNAGNNTSPNNIVVKDSKVVNAGYLFSGYCDTFTATNVTATNVKHFVNNQGSGITVENCTVDCYTDYAIRANAGPVSITGSTFVMTYTGSDKGGVYVDRGNNTQLTMTGNTYPATYAGANMHDVYNAEGGPCIISNGSQVVETLENGGTYDFPRN